VVRGGPVRRTRDARVRLTTAEHTAWTAARDRSGRRELGAWVRATVNGLLDLPPGDRPGYTPPSAQLVDAAVYAALVRAGNNLNQLARWANSERRYPDQVRAAAVYRDVAAAVAEIRTAIAAAAARTRDAHGRDVRGRDDGAAGRVPR
jgi:mobilization protein MobC